MTQQWNDRIVVPYAKFIQMKQFIKQFTVFINRKLSGKCNDIGYIIPNSIKIISHSVGRIVRDDIYFDVVLEGEYFQCHEGDKLKMVITSVTQIGIRGVSPDSPPPYSAYVPIDYMDEDNIVGGLPNYSVGDTYEFSVVAHRHKLYDMSITIIGKPV
jgi:hypothetical protein